MPLQEDDIDGFVTLVAADWQVPKGMLLGENIHPETATMMANLLNRKSNYVMVNRKPVAINMHEQTAYLIKDRHRKRPRSRVRHTHFGGVLISTVMLTIDHGHNDDKPLVFETMLFKADGTAADCERCYTHRQALRQHREMITKFKQDVKNGNKQKPVS